MKILPMGLTALLSMSLLACGGGETKPAKTPADVPAKGDGKPEPKPAGAKPAGDDKPAPKAAAGFPTSCDREADGVCYPPKKFAHGLCQKDYPTIAVAMFASDAPWTKAYVSQKAKAWNAIGPSSNEPIPRGEEVVILYRRAPKNKTGIQVSGQTVNYDVMRWNGMCITLDQHEMSLQPVGRKLNARIEMKRLEEKMADALKEDETIYKAWLARRKECKGASVGAVSKKCVTLDKKLNKVFVDRVPKLSGLPTPKKKP